MPKASDEFRMKLSLDLAIHRKAAMSVLALLGFVATVVGLAATLWFAMH